MKSTLPATNSLGSIHGVTQDKAYWEYHVAQQAKSAQSRSKYCKAHDVSLHRFHYWANKIAAASKATRSGFVNVRLKNPTSVSSIELPVLCTLNLVSGMTLKIHDASVLAHLFQGAL